MIDVEMRSTKTPICKYIVSKQFIRHHLEGEY